MSNKRYKYSVCIPNYNMADTLRPALTSVLNQLDDEYEVLVLDDGSSDGSRSVLLDLQKNFPNLRVLFLERDPKRKLGETRNITIREARGEYVILHIDADDVWEPFIKDFVNLYHKLEKQIGEDILLSGQQINIANRNFLLSYGPYRNTHRAQDRDMWLRFAAMGRYYPMEHRVFRKRLPRPKRISFFKGMRDSWYHILYDLRRGTNNVKYIIDCLTGLFFPQTKNFGFKMRLFRAVAILPVFFVSRISDPLPPPENMQSHQDFADYRDRTRGTWQELMVRFGGDPDMSFLSEEAQKVFSEKYSSL